MATAFVISARCFPAFSHPATDNPEHGIDLVITLGGDGTILHASSLFKVGAVPPVLSFSMGTLGFLLPFRKLLLSFLCSFQGTFSPPTHAAVAREM